MVPQSLRDAAQEWMNVARRAGVVTPAQANRWDIIPADAGSGIPYSVLFRNYKGKKVILCTEYGVDLSAAHTPELAEALLRASAQGMDAALRNQGV